VPLASVKEALAVVLTDLGTRAKNAGGAPGFSSAGAWVSSGGGGQLHMHPWQHALSDEHSSGTAAAAAATAPYFSTTNRTAANCTADCTVLPPMTGRASECESLYRQALALCPTYPSAHYNLGVLASESRRWLDALQHYKDTLALAPHHAQVSGSALCTCAAHTCVGSAGVVLPALTPGVWSVHIEALSEQAWLLRVCVACV
jgi:tetratricopeptide (TPR) repeat protein